MENIILTSEQQLAYDEIGITKKLFLEGAAGCGKSIVITEKMKHSENGTFLLCATTNQACRILGEKLNTGLEIPTLQATLGMKPVFDGSTKDESQIVDFKFTKLAKDFTALKGVNLIIDEASMICRHVQRYIEDLLEHDNVNSVTYVGDRNQLPCVKKDAFDYEQVDKIITLKLVQRAKGELLDYYNTIRNEVITDSEITIHTSKAKYFDSNEEFVEYMNSLSGSKIVISWTNEAADSYTKILDQGKLYEGQEATSLGYCSYKHLYKDDYIKVITNSNIIIEKLFSDYSAMKRDAIRSEYEYQLPSKTTINIDAIIYAKILNEDNQMMYLSIWNEPAKMKESLYLNKMTREYRKFLDSIKYMIPTNIWNKYSKEDGYPKSLKYIKAEFLLSNDVVKKDQLFWNDFMAINDAIPTRSKFSTTAHRVQGTTVEYAGINWENLSKSTDKRLQYVALTRASKELIFYTGAQNEKV